MQFTLDQIAFESCDAPPVAFIVDAGDYIGAGVS